MHVGRCHSASSDSSSCCRGGDCGTALRTNCHPSLSTEGSGKGRGAASHNHCAGRESSAPFERVGMEFACHAAQGDVIGPHGKIRVIAGSSSVTAAPATAATATTTTATATPTYRTAMASLRVLAFDHEGRPVQFDTWLDDLQLYLLSDSKDTVSLFDLVSGTATAPPTTANTQALYDAVVARYSSPANAALGCLILPYLFPELSAFATVEDLVSHIRASVARYRAAVPAEFLDRNPPPMYITLYFIVTRLPDSLRCVRDHFLSLDPTSLTVDLLEKHLLAAETSAVAVGAVIVTIGLNVPKTKDREHRRISAQRIQTFIPFCS
ncbi:unnamed protein product [Closterium sp. NIES-53]